MPVYGTDDYAKAFGPARDLSFAFQLTNILRDVREDLLRGRCYIPSEDLERFSVKTDDFLEGGDTFRLGDLYRFEAARCEAYFKKGSRVLEYLHSDSRRCVSVMTGAYHTLLEKIMRDPVRSLESQVFLSKEDKEKITSSSR